MGDKTISYLSQIVHTQGKQNRELKRMRSELANVTVDNALDEEIRRMNRSPYVQDRPFHKIQSLKGSEKENDWKEVKAALAQDSHTAELVLAKVLKSSIKDVDMETREKRDEDLSSAELALKKLNII